MKSFPVYTHAIVSSPIIKGKPEFAWRCDKTEGNVFGHWLLDVEIYLQFGACGLGVYRQYQHPVASLHSPVTSGRFRTGLTLPQDCCITNQFYIG
jgi:hypothetical protein